ncbi:MAG TPA: AsnC family transcriptional regulator [Sporosarcina psychrophila]|uniref:AsnC family transcriptional regulator n=1 Tax=Sporosarcina psychrophila TaxID=1476 RepID=A0A921KBZ3_SPOPS|nr:AsnC family transcriptional regulator [Sporosarcina psychrophila]
MKIYTESWWIVKSSIDDLDKNIIKLLSKDGRMSFRDLSKFLEVTEKTIRMRYMNLIDSGILEIVGKINPITIGLKEGAIIQLKIKANGLYKVIADLKEIQHIRYITVTTGDYPLLIQVAAANQEQITELILSLYEHSEVTELNTMIQLEVSKSSYQVT